MAKKTETKVVCMGGGKGAGEKKNILRKDIFDKLRLGRKFQVLPFQHLVDDFLFLFSFLFFTLEKIRKNKNILKFLQLMWGKKMPGKFALLKHTASPSFRAGNQ